MLQKFQARRSGVQEGIDGRKGRKGQDGRPRKTVEEESVSSNESRAAELQSCSIAVLLAS